MIVAGVMAAACALYAPPGVLLYLWLRTRGLQFIPALGLGLALLELLAIFGNGPMGKISGTSEQTPLTVTGQDVGGTQKVPLVLLVGAETQGASEIFAAALQASRRAVLVGQSTPGKVMRYNTSTLPDGS